MRGGNVGVCIGILQSADVGAGRAEAGGGAVLAEGARLVDFSWFGDGVVRPAGVVGEAIRMLV